jgi:hypothetical protein
MNAQHDAIRLGMKEESAITQATLADRALESPRGGK